MTTYKVRVCPVCGTENPATASDCQSCQADILAEPLETRFTEADVPPEATALKQPTGPAIVLEAVENPDVKFTVGEGQSVGRTNEADVVLKGARDLDYVSRRMAVFSRRGEQWYVQHVGTTNYITVDGERYDADDDIAVHDGSVIGLALSQFLVRICKEEPNADAG